MEEREEERVERGDGASIGARRIRILAKATSEHGPFLFCRIMVDSLGTPFVWSTQAMDRVLNSSLSIMDAVNLSHRRAIQLT